MGYFKDAEIETVEALNEAARAAIESIAPTLSKLYCDEGEGELLEIWDSWIDELEEEARGDFNPLVGKFKRFDCFYTDRLMNEVAGFVIVSMENDW